MKELSKTLESGRGICAKCNKFFGTAEFVSIPGAWYLQAVRVVDVRGAIIGVPGAPKTPPPFRAFCLFVTNQLRHNGSCMCNHDCIRELSCKTYVKPFGWLVQYGNSHVPFGPSTPSITASVIPLNTWASEQALYLSTRPWSSPPSAGPEDISLPLISVPTG